MTLLCTCNESISHNLILYPSTFQIKLHSLSARVIVEVVDPDEALQRLVHPLPRLGVQPVRLGRHRLHRAEGERRRHVEVRAGITAEEADTLFLWILNLRTQNDALAVSVKSQNCCTYLFLELKFLVTRLMPCTLMSAGRWLFIDSTIPGSLTERPSC